MRHTRAIQSPVLTFLGPNETSINRSVLILKNVLGLQEIKLPNNDLTKSSNVTSKNDILSEKLSFNPSSVILKCPETNTKFQFLSAPSTSSSSNKDYMLFTCMTNGLVNEGNADDIQHARDYLASNILSTTSSNSSSSALSSKALSFWNKLMGRNPIIHLFQDENLPFVETSSVISMDEGDRNGFSRVDNELKSKAYLREIVLPYFEDEGGITQSFLHTLQKPINPHTNRPMTGLYRWPVTTKDKKPVYIRPIPAGPEDQYLSPPSLVFQIPSSSFDNVIVDFGSSTDTIQYRKIGFNGNSSNKGQYIILHKSLNGIDIRLCPNTELSSSFNEGEDTLFAGSIDELQRSNSSIASSSSCTKSEVEYGDCWMEVRAMVKQYPNRLWEKYIAGDSDVWRRRRRKGKNVSMLFNKNEENSCSEGKGACNTKCGGRIVKAPKIVFE